MSSLDRDRGYLRSPGTGGKVRCIRRDPHVRLAPCTARGRPTGPAHRLLRCGTAYLEVRGVPGG